MKLDLNFINVIKICACSSTDRALGYDQEVLGSNPSRRYKCNFMKKINSLSIVFPLYKDKRTVRKMIFNSKKL